MSPFKEKKKLIRILSFTIYISYIVYSESWIVILFVWFTVGNENSIIWILKIDFVHNILFWNNLMYFNSIMP